MSHKEDDARDAELLKSAIEKVARKYERLAPWARAKNEGSILMQMTTGELRVLRQFHSKFYDDPIDTSLTSPDDMGFPE